ncbi:acyltransferase [Pontibacter sp. 172403-2]|uniref:acyltransferase n=1 Tax=Pontibacter rufus TaxID=2791028 RepID=UPI0018AFCCB8|nr:acyltransferase [Pontibacter sp. 172403-2]MBF9253837.1 acyltransferase [Pontibacter sp. 172403-2]
MKFKNSLSIGRRFSLNILHQDSLIEFGDNVSMRNDCHFFVDAGHILIGNNVFFNNSCSVNCMGDVCIGDNSILGEGVKIYDHNHRFKDRSMNVKEQGFSIGTVKIGNNCWIGSNVTILKDVIIGDNVVIGANCLIKESIPSNFIVTPKNELVLTAIARPDEIK